MNTPVNSLIWFIYRTHQSKYPYTNILFTSSKVYTEAQYEIRYEVQKIAHDYKLTMCT